MGPFYLSLIIAAGVTVVTLLFSTTPKESQTSKYEGVKTFLIAFGTSYIVLRYLSDANVMRPEIETADPDW
jgi:hypothetical protein